MPESREMSEMPSLKGKRPRAAVIVRWLPLLLALCGLIVFFPRVVRATSWVVYDQSSGFPGPKVLSFAASRKNLAVGTDLGVALYSTETSFWSPLPLPDAIASSEVRDLAFDRNGQLWIATPKGIGHLQDQGIEVYSTADGLPTVDVERFQIVENTLYVGTYGGLVAKAEIPLNGKATFFPVSYQSSGEAKELQAINISGLALSNGLAGGWISTRGSGLIQFQGLSKFPLDKTSGLSSDWVEAFWVFPGPDKAENIIAATAEGLCLIKNRQVVGTETLRRSEKVWLTGLATIRKPDGEDDDVVPKADLNTSERRLSDFLGKRSLWVGTKADGLWRFENGEWTNYTPDTSRLPTRAVNRIYVLGDRLFVCTDQGLVMVSIEAHAFDEFNRTGHGVIGSKNFKTIYPAAEQTPVRMLALGKSLWAAHDIGLARFPQRARTGSALDQANTEISGSQETSRTQAVEERELDKGVTAQAVSIESEVENFSREQGTLWSNKITRMISANGDGVWIIFDEKLLARLNIVRKPGKATAGRPTIVEKPQWLFVKDALQPWPEGTPVSGLWMENGSLYVGTRGQGYYVLENPTENGTGEQEFRWQHFGSLEGLGNLDVIGFAKRRLPDGPAPLAILHPKGLTLFDGNLFTPCDLNGIRDYSCIAGDDEGGLWIGSDGGALRLTPEGKLLTYTRTNANLSSDRVTAIATIAKSGGGIGVWVACDDKEIGSDQTPNTMWVWSDGRRTPAPRVCSCNPNSCEWPTGVVRIEVLEQEIDGASLNYYDGTTWDVWKIPGVLCLAADDAYLWIGTNIRIRRIRFSS